jgi:hypothetical protein
LALRLWVEATLAIEMSACALGDDLTLKGRAALLGMGVRLKKAKNGVHSN